MDGLLVYVLTFYNGSINTKIATSELDKIAIIAEADSPVSLCVATCESPVTTAYRSSHSSATFYILSSVLSSAGDAFSRDDNYVDGLAVCIDVCGFIWTQHSHLDALCR